mmetsp:Transcript_7987/g.11321  ORF Transcript_7987/g.11321 Transcript_7987/m.11321 type:complete len:110 (-) Transcript_7987:263-592(-)|eukprot:CAMPEP_0184487294 /NCGR_PEP_ID=MMETSP0113_2-20130426/9707_1 /TAXON_ID=91329 /ORGANISM="Norrisiella sphaerica, Strain BC52" /LENGTH=109 /DNA_ID=CAMNT_0026869541 /DNA_START=38 /DNA_END=367 /DNA_ORIENTATION=+
MPIQWYEVNNNPPYKGDHDYIPKNQKYKHAKLGMEKVWGGVQRTNGQITHMVSPYKLKIVGPMLKKGPMNIFKTLKTNAPFFAPGFGVVAFAYYYGNWKFAQDALHHRD